MSTEELQGVEGVRARMSKYNEALKKKSLTEQKQDVGILDETQKDVAHFQSPSKDKKKKVGMIGNLSSSIMTKFESLAGRNVSKEERIRAELKAKEELGKLLAERITEADHLSDSSRGLESNANLTPETTSPNDHGTDKKVRPRTLVSALSFKSIRPRYIKAIDECRPKKTKDSQDEFIDASKNKKIERKIEAQKKDRFVNLRQVWDRYEVTAQDKPKLASPGESEIRQQIYQVEDEIVDTWVVYANNVVEEIMVEMEDKLANGDIEDEDDDGDDDMKYWMREAQRMKAEAEANRKAKEEFLRQQEENEVSQEDEYWLVEALRLKELNHGKKKSKKKKKDCDVATDGNDQDDPEVESGDGNEELLNPYDDSVDIMALAAATRRATQALYSNNSPKFSPAKNNSQISPHRPPVVSGTSRDGKTPAWVKTSDPTKKAASTISPTAFMTKPIFDDDDDGRAH